MSTTTEMCSAYALTPCDDADDPEDESRDIPEMTVEDVDDRVDQLERRTTARLNDLYRRSAFDADAHVDLDARLQVVERQLSIALKALQRLGQLPEGWS